MTTPTTNYRLSLLARIGDAIDAYENNDSATSIDIFREVVETYRSAIGEYNLGVIALNNNRREDARRHFACALHANDLGLTDQTPEAALQLYEMHSEDRDTHAAQHIALMYGENFKYGETPKTGLLTPADYNEIKLDTTPLGNLFGDWFETNTND